MDLTIEQALQEGIAAHKEGKLHDAERLYRAILQTQPRHPDANHNLGVLAVSVNKADAALPLLKTALEANPKIEQFWFSYIDALIKQKQYENAKQFLGRAKKQGVDADRLESFEAQLLPETREPSGSSRSPPQALINNLLWLHQERRFIDAEKLALEITKGFPRDAAAYSNLGATQRKLGKLDEAVESYGQAIALKPDFAEAHNNLGNTLQEQGRLDEAEASYSQAIALKPDYAEAHNNLGVTLRELGRRDEAEASYSQAIALKPDYAEAHSNLGVTLQELGKLDGAEASYKQAIALKSDSASPHYGLSIVLYIKGNEDLALKSIVKANDLEPQSQDYELLLSVMAARESRKSNDVADSDLGNMTALKRLVSNPLILNRVVEPELITSLYEMNSIQLDKTKRGGFLASGKNDARYGNGTVSPDFNLFKERHTTIQKLAKDLKKIMMEALNSDIYIYDSFFNILSAGGGTTPHAHLNAIDRIIGLNIGKQKYSLVYYLSVGDQNCREPGILKLYEPDEDILPCEGMIAIIPASRMHSSVYSGKTDRIMIGVNFYSL